jgi:hypothetical protein
MARHTQRCQRRPPLHGSRLELVTRSVPKVKAHLNQFGNQFSLVQSSWPNVRFFFFDFFLLSRGPSLIAPPDWANVAKLGFEMASIAGGV